MRPNAMLPQPGFSPPPDPACPKASVKSLVVRSAGGRGFLAAGAEAKEERSFSVRLCLGEVFLA